MKSIEPHVYTVFLKKGKLTQDDVLVASMMLAKVMVQYKVKHLRLHVHFIGEVPSKLFTHKNEAHKQIIAVNVGDDGECLEYICKCNNMLKKYMKYLPEHMRLNALELGNIRIPKNPDNKNIASLIIKTVRTIGRFRRIRKKERK